MNAERKKIEKKYKQTDTNNYREKGKKIKKEKEIYSTIEFM
jgi:hypothetical protein